MPTYKDTLLSDLSLISSCFVGDDVKDNYINTICQLCIYNVINKKDNHELLDCLKVKSNNFNDKVNKISIFINRAADDNANAYFRESNSRGFVNDFLNKYDLSSWKEKPSYLSSQNTEPDADMIKIIMHLIKHMKHKNRSSGSFFRNNGHATRAALQRVMGKKNLDKILDLPQLNKRTVDTQVIMQMITFSLVEKKIETPVMLLILQEAMKLTIKTHSARIQEARRQEAKSQEAKRQKARRQEAKRQEARRQEARRLRAEKQQARRQEAMKQEAIRQAEKQQAKRKLVAKLKANSLENMIRLNQVGPIFEALKKCNKEKRDFKGSDVPYPSHPYDPHK